MSDSTTKRCTKCDEQKPATSEYFVKDKNRKDGLYPHCKTCMRAYRQSNREAISKKSREWRDNNSQYIIDYHLEYNQRNREARAKQAIEHYWKNRERINLKRKANSHKHRDWVRQYHRKNKERIYIRNHEWRQKNVHRVAVNRHRYDARKLELPDTWTAQEWLNCLDYWHYCCAVCGGQLRGLFDIKPHADHWIPLSSLDCPGTIATNMICLCNTCNLSKHDRLPQDWLTLVHGKQKAKVILSKIDAYFTSIRNLE